MEFSVTHTYQRSKKAVFGVLTDFDLVRQKYQALGHADIELVNFSDPLTLSLSLASSCGAPASR